MNLLLLVPLGLAAFAALLLPLLLHLARRSEPRTSVFAALQWLRPRPQPQRRHRLEELLLLLLRMLLLALLALLLAQPVLFGRPDLRPYVALAPGVQTAAARDVVSMPDARWHRLAPGFPEIKAEAGDDRDSVDDKDATLPSLLRELDASLPAGAPLTVVVPHTLDGADAQRPVLSRRVDWRLLPEALAPAPPRQAPRMAEDSFALAVRHAPDRAASLRYLRAVGIAWAAEARSEGANKTAASPATRVTVALLDAPIDASTRNLAWLASGPLPQNLRDWIANGGRVLLDSASDWPGMDQAPVLWRDAEGALVRGLPFGRGRVMQLQRPLLPAAMPALLEPDFPARLRALFADAPPAPARVDAADYAPLAGAPPWPEQPRPLSPWLLWAVAIAFLLERWVANGRRRSDAA